jgi:hypothetical protein
MPDDAQTTHQAATGFQLTPEFLGVLAEAIGTALNRQPPVEVGPAHSPDAATAVMPAVTPTPAQTGEVLGKVLAPLAAPVLARCQHRLASRKFWTMAGTMVTLLVSNAPAINLPPIAQLCIAAVGALYIAAQAIVDSAGKGGRVGMVEETTTAKGI